MDHSGSIIEVIDAVGPERVFASANGVKALQAHFHHDKHIEAVAHGGTLSLGNMSLAFVETKMIHWPDSMISFLPERGVLFSQDAFGMHLATTGLFADETPRWILEWEAQKYYANIVMPYSGIVGKALAALRELNLPITMIAPDHGPIWRTPEQIEWILGLYDTWVAQKPTPRAVVIYDTMWQSTDTMARAVAGGLKHAGVEAKVMPLSGAHRSDVATEVIESGALIVGSCTMNNQIFPTVADVLTYLKGLKPLNLVGASFGSYGWSMNALKDLDQWLQEMKIEAVAEPVRVNYVPTSDDLMQCRELGATVGKELLARCT
jgi:flavorubredoxin